MEGMYVLCNCHGYALERRNLDGAKLALIVMYCDDGIQRDVE